MSDYLVEYIDFDDYRTGGKFAKDVPPEFQKQHDINESSKSDIKRAAEVVASSVDLQVSRTCPKNKKQKKTKKQKTKNKSL